MTRKELQRAIGAMNDAIEYFDERTEADLKVGKIVFAGERERLLCRDLNDAIIPLQDADVDWGQRRERE